MTLRNLSHISAAVALLVLSAAGTRPSAKSHDLTGTWFTTLAFPGERPLQTVITFLQNDAGRKEQLGAGHWAKTSANKFRVAFRLPAEGPGTEAGYEYRMTGLLTLGTLGQLRGPLERELLDSTGKPVDSTRGVAIATRILPPKSERKVNPQLW